MLLLYFSTAPEIKQDYPLNLSISVSGGKENNYDSPSNGERTGNSSICKSEALSFRIVILYSEINGYYVSSLEEDVIEGDNPVDWYPGVRI